MALSKTERRVIEKIIARMQKEGLGGAQPWPGETVMVPEGYHVVHRIYVNTWLIGPLQSMLDGESKTADWMLK